ncbi:MAG TPA: hypothetical protein PLI16_08965 [Bacteroidales bacterium]|jgi:hypothetical protein|nr:hypothetical protein [Bacteroidales bacterium]HOH84727.1 hypothetical protein [Bacteroidales bacterium]HPB25510.1 hypothetical protein [Bacteroidales bacterium]HPI30206.1 hypothetical protein [Bacteroidales bacterium]HQN16131.1 hypothetical protein [Bacteroidales bacterium]
MKLKNFNWSVFLLTTIILCVLLIPSSFAALAEDEGTLSADDTFMSFFVGLFYILRFPTHTLVLTSLSLGGPLVFWGGLLVNCMIYGLLTERIVSVFRGIFWKNKSG